MIKKKEIYFILIALCFLLYANSLNNVFISDDIPTILNDQQISHPLHFWLYPASFFHSLNYLIARHNPFVYHLTNIILHSLNTILVFFFLNLFFNTEGSFLGAILFAVHPIHTEAVTWISGRPYLFVASFILGAYLLYYNATLKDKNFKPSYYLLSLTFFSYSVVNINPSFHLLFPFFLILSDVTLKRWKRNWKWWIPFLAILILRVFLAKALVAQRIAQVAKDMGTGVTWNNPFFNMVYSIFSHLFLLLWPAKLTLYHEPAVISAFNLRLGILALTLLGLTLPFIFKKAREIFFALCLFILFLIPTYSPVTVAWLVAERYLYFPSLALSIAVAFFYERVLKNYFLTRILTNQKPNSHEFWFSFFIFIIACYAVRTVARNEDWKSAERLWRQTLVVSYNSPRAQINMGDVYNQEGNLERAIQGFKKAIELKPDYADAYHNLATVYFNKGEIQEAIRAYQQAIRFNPQLVESHHNLGIIYLNSGEWDLAVVEFRKVVELRPQDKNAQQILEFVLKKSVAK